MRQKGFTLIELIIVIVILGILAAFAVPKYMNLDKEARKSVVRGLEGSIRAASEMVHAIAVSQNITTGSVNIGDGNVAIVNGGYPGANSAGIGAALSDVSGFTAVAGNGTIRYERSGGSNNTACAVTYSAADGSRPVIALGDVNAGC